MRTNPRLALLAMTTFTASALAATPATTPPPRAATAPAAPAVKPCDSVTVDPPTYLTLGKSRVIRLNFPAARLIVGGQSSSRAGRPVATGENAPAMPGGAPRPVVNQQASDGVADTEITLLSPTELFFLGKKTGSMNVVLQSADGRCVVKDIVVTVDPETLQGQLTELLPSERDVKVRAAENMIVLTGSVSDAARLDEVVSLATSYGDGKKVVNLLRINTPQQVMLEVKIAEVSKTLLDHFGLDFSRMVTSANGLTSSVISGIIGGAGGVLGQFHPNIVGGAISGSSTAAIGGSNAGAGAVGSASISATSKGSTLLGLDMQRKDGILRVLAEPNIMAISGQAASFLSGGKIFIPVAQNNAAGGATFTLEEKEFGVGLKFTPTVLDGSRINLKLVSEVSELSQTGSPFTTVGNVTAILPSMSTRRVDTTVQLNDGQSFAVAGLIKNNATEALTKFPGLGEVPVMGALFRSTEFQTDQTELMFVVTPRLVKPAAAPIALPTDNHVMPNSADAFWMGSGEGKAPPPAGAAAAGATPAAVPVIAPTPVPAAVAAPAPAAAPAAPAVAPAITPAAVSAPALAPSVSPTPVSAPTQALRSSPAPSAEAAPVASPAPVRSTSVEGAPLGSPEPEAVPVSAAGAAPVASYMRASDTGN